MPHGTHGTEKFSSLRCGWVGTVHDAQRSAYTRSGKLCASHHVPVAKSPAGGLGNTGKPAAPKDFLRNVHFLGGKFTWSTGVS